VAALTDEILMAYADGALDRDMRARVEALLHQDAESRRRVEIFRATGASLAGLFDKAMYEPIPSHLVDFVLEDRGARPSRAKANRLKDFIGAWVQRLIPRPQGLSWQLAAASAAALALLAGAGWMLRGTFADDAGGSDLTAMKRGQIFAAGAIRQILDSAPSGREARISGSAQKSAVMRVSLSFKNKDGQYCREYELAATGGGQFTGVACRLPGGSWRVLGHFPQAAARPGVQIVPAGNETALEPIVNSIIAGDALGKAEEEAAIANGWK
jgi:surface antigen